MYCKNCGAEIRSGNKFCSKCGKQLKNYFISKEDPVENFFIYLVSLLIPFVGIIIWLSLKDDNYRKARISLILSLVNIAIVFLLIILFFVFFFLFIISGIGGV